MALEDFMIRFGIHSGALAMRGAVDFGADLSMAFNLFTFYREVTLVIEEWFMDRVLQEVHHTE